MSPPYVFRVDEIAEAPDALQHVDNSGHWLPSIDPNANIRRGGGVSGRWWYCDTQSIREEPGLPAECALYKTYSVYYSGGYGFWVLRGDATNPPDDAAWHPLMFEWDERDFSSFLTNAGEHNTLRVQRSDQQWPGLLLPDIYHSQTITPYTAYGGLKGELPIFLALIAFSTARDWLPNVLPIVFTEGCWNAHHYAARRISQRGVVVSVYTAPLAVSGRTSARASAIEIAQYENGAWGNYFN